MAYLENARERSAQRAESVSMRPAQRSFNARTASLIPWLLVLAFLALWELLAHLGWISPLFFPAPTRILRTVIDLSVSGKLIENLIATLGRLIAGLLLGSLPGLVLGLGMGWSTHMRTIVDPIIAALHPIPKIAIFPLIMIIFGIGEISKIVAVAIAAFFPMLINSMAGVRQLHPVYFEVARNYGASRWKTFTRLILPGSLPLILTGIRLSINMAMVITIAVELISAKKGLGVMIWFSWQTLRVEELYASLLVTSLLGISSNFILQTMTRLIVPWHGRVAIDDS